MQKESRSWLSPPDPSPNYNIARETHQDGTATWFCEGGVFREWNANGSLLWIHGKRASPKTRIATILIPFPRHSGFWEDYIDVRDAHHLQ